MAVRDSVAQAMSAQRIDPTTLPQATKIQILFAVLVGLFLAALDQTIVSTAAFSISAPPSIIKIRLNGIGVEPQLILAEKTKNTPATNAKNNSLSLIGLTLFKLFSPKDSSVSRLIHG